MHDLIVKVTVNKGLHLEPNEFCQKWLEHPKPGEWGYRKACVTLLAEATGLSERTIENWGKDFDRRPDYIITILNKDDALREIQKILDNKTK